MCKDPALTYLNSLGYNVVRHPKADIAPLEVLGRQRRRVERLGTLQHLAHGSESRLPVVQRDIEAAGIEGKRSAKLDLNAGLKILSNCLSAMFGDIAATGHFSSFATMQFLFTEVRADRCHAAAIGEFLSGSMLRVQNPIWHPYLEGAGQLYIITEVIKSHKINAIFESASSVGGKVDVPVLKQALGANAAIEVSESGAATVSFTGTAPLIFGFKCLEIGFDENGLPTMRIPRSDVAYVVDTKTSGPFPASSPTGTAEPLLQIEDLLDIVDAHSL